VRKVEENTPFSKYANAAWAEWAERGAGGLRGIAGRRGRGWAGWAEIRRNFLFEQKLKFSIYQGFEICTRRFRRNFDMMIFPKFF
jgi:hypothetical protein